MVFRNTSHLAHPSPIYPPAAGGISHFRHFDSSLGNMPAKSDVWILFKTRPDPHNLHKPLKYKNNKSHSAAWCSGCVDCFVEVQAAFDALNLSQGNLTQDEVRTPDQLRAIGKFTH